MSIYNSGPERRTLGPSWLPLPVSLLAGVVAYRVGGPPLDSEGIARRREQLPMHNAHIGQQAIRHARATGDDGLRLQGEAMVTLAAAKVAEEGILSPPERDKLADQAARVAGKAADNPHLSPETVRLADQLIDLSPKSNQDEA